MFGSYSFFFFAIVHSFWLLLCECVCNCFVPFSLDLCVRRVLFSDWIWCTSKIHDFQYRMKTFMGQPVYFWSKSFRKMANFCTDSRITYNYVPIRRYRLFFVFGMRATTTIDGNIPREYWCVCEFFFSFISFLMWYVVLIVIYFHLKMVLFCDSSDIYHQFHQ